jgi:translation initiation factor IF-2
MTKVRVYELAKDLNMTNRALLNKMKELKIEVKSHMSSLEDSDIRAIKRGLFGKKKQKNGEKIKPSVIRRRKQKVEETSDPDSEEDIAEEMPVKEMPGEEIIVETEIAPADQVKAEPEKTEDQPGEEGVEKAVDAQEGEKITACKNC